MKILLTEGSSTSARQTLYALGRQGHTVDICDPQRLCLGRFSRYVRAWYRCPSFTTQPVEYLRFLLDRLRRERYDVLFPVHDQVYLLARFRELFQPLTGLALPDFDIVDQVQNKASFARLLGQQGFSHPPTVILTHPDELAADWEFPRYIKLAISTAGCGVWLVRNADELTRVTNTIRGLWRDHKANPEILVQQPVSGEFLVIQAVFDLGALAAAHCYRGRAIGVGGSAHARVSVSNPAMIDDMAQLGAHLGWHGALVMECFHDPETGRHTYLEANPRIGETFNATLSGTNLCDLLARISAGEPWEPAELSRVGVRTHSLMMSLMGAAERGAGRGALLAELWRALSKRDVYENSQDELTRPREDFLSLIPVTAITLQLLFRPALARRIIRRAVDNYSLNAAAIRRVQQIRVEMLGLDASATSPPPTPCRWGDD